MASNEDLLFVELALKRELVSQNQVDEILALKKKLETMGLDESVADLMIKKGVLAQTDAQSLRMKVSPKGGQQIEGYRLLERIGRGGMGSVYKGIQLSMGREVAIKVLSPALTRDEKQVARLRREAQLVGKLKHENIVQGVDHGESGGFHYFAMEYVEGESARDLIVKRGTFKEKDALKIVTQIAEAIEHAHSEGIVHRDIKPGNILVAKDGRVKLADYGLAKGPLEDVELTQSGVTVGTPQYISPEQARGPSAVDIRTDIYSLGATLYHMVTGRPPYEGETLAHLIQQVLYEPYAPPQTLRRNLAKDTAFLIEKMMARHPRHRYQNPRELLADLKRIEAGKSIVPAGWQGDIEAFYLRRRLRRWAAAAVVVILLGISVTVYTAYRNRMAEQKKLEEAARQRFDGLAAVTVTPENLVQLIPRYETIIEDYGGTEGAGLAKEVLDDLKSRKRPLDRAITARENSMRSLEEEEYKAALDALERTRAEVEGERGDLARQILDGVSVQVERKRDQSAAKRIRGKLEDLQSATPEEAQTELASLLFELRRTHYLEGEQATQLTEADGLVRALNGALREMRRGVDPVKERLAAATLRNYMEIEALRAEKQREFLKSPLVQQLLGALLPSWSRQLGDRFEVLSGRILESNVTEQEEAVAKVGELREEGRFQEGMDLLEELKKRSLDPVAGDLYRAREELEGILSSRVEQASHDWDAFLTPFAMDLAQRRWPAARLKIQQMQERFGAVVPYPSEVEILEAERLLERMQRLEGEFLETINGLKFIPDGLTFRDVRIGSPVHDVRVEGRKIFFSRRPGGAVEEGHAEMVSAADLKRIAGHTLLRDEPLHPIVYGLLDLAELLERPPQERQLGLRTRKSDIQALAGKSEEYQVLATELARVFDEEIIRAVAELGQLERDAHDRFEEGKSHMKWNRWQEAFDAFNQLLNDKRFKNTRYVKDRVQEIEDKRDEAERNLSSVKLGEHLRGRVRHLAGTPVDKPGESEVAITWDLDEPWELERFEFTEGRVGIVNEERVFIGPPGRDTPIDKVTTVEDHHLRFHPPKKQPADRLNHHPFRMRSPLLYSRQMEISFRVRWERPLALIVSLCGTNLLVLSDTSRRENGRGVHIWQGKDLSRPDAIAPEALRTTTLEDNPQLLTGEEAHRRYFRFEPDRWYRLKFVKGEKFATLWVDDRRVYEQQVKQYSQKNTDEILLLTYSPMRLDDLSMRGTVDASWYRREVKRK